VSSLAGSYRFTATTGSLKQKLHKFIPIITDHAIRLNCPELHTEVYNNIDFRFDKLFVCKFVYIIPVWNGFVNRQITVFLICFVVYSPNVADTTIRRIFRGLLEFNNYYHR
jgi:hypothetical protein